MIWLENRIAKFQENRLIIDGEINEKHALQIYLNKCVYNPAQNQTAVTAYFKSKHLLLFAFARRSACQYSMAEENPAA